MLAVGQHKDAALNAAQEFLDDHATRRIAEHTAQHLLQFALGIIQRRHYQHTLAGTQAVSLQHVGCFERFQKGQAFLQMLAVERLVARRRNAVALHEALGKIL